jgi:hypothetical protein
LPAVRYAPRAGLGGNALLDHRKLGSFRFKEGEHEGNRGYVFRLPILEPVATVTNFSRNVGFLV